MNAIVLMGAPGSGKTTVGKGVAAELGLTFIGSGDIARDMAKIDIRASDALSTGEMAPELAMREEVRLRIESAVASTGDFVIEGFPRTVEQIYILESVPGIEPIYILLNCDELLCMRRIILRRRNGEHADAVATRFRTWWQFVTEIRILWNNMHEIDGAGHIDDVQWQVLDCYRRESKVT